MLLGMYLFLGAFVSSFVKGITGFANTLILNSWYSFCLPNRLITPIDLILGFPCNVYMLWINRKNIHLREILPVILIVVCGIFPGIYLLKYGDPKGLKVCLSIAIMGLAVEMMTRKRTTVKQSMPKWLLAVVAFVSGLMIGMYGIGALLVAYFDRTCVNKNEFRANICAVFLADNIYRFIHYGIQGFFSMEVLRYVLMAFPAIALGFYVSTKVDKKISEDTVRKAVIAMLFVSGAALLVKTLLLPAA